MTMISNPDNLKAYLNTREASKYLRLSPRTLQNMRVSGEGPIFRRHGRRVFYQVSDLIEWSDAHKLNCTSDAC